MLFAAGAPNNNADAGSGQHKWHVHVHLVSAKSNHSQVVEIAIVQTYCALSHYHCAATCPIACAHVRY